MNAPLRWLLVSVLLATSSCSSTAVIDPVQQGGPLGASAAPTAGTDAKQVRQPLSKAEAIAVAEKFVVDQHRAGPTYDASAHHSEIETKAWGIAPNDEVWMVVFRFAERDLKFPFWHDGPDGGRELVTSMTSETCGKLVMVHAHTGKAWFSHYDGVLAAFERVPRDHAGR